MLHIDSIMFLRGRGEWRPPTDVPPAPGPQEIPGDEPEEMPPGEPEEMPPESDPVPPGELPQ